MTEPTPSSTASRFESDAERLSFVLAAAQLGDWSWDATTDVVTMSARAAEIFGIPTGPHMTWTAMRGLLHPEDREAARIAVERALAERGNYAIEYRLTNGSRERWVLASGRGRYDERGGILGMLGVVQNITSDRLLVRLDDAVRPLVDAEAITYTAARVLGQYLDVNRCAYAFVKDDQDTFILTGNYTNGVQSIVGRYRFRQFGAECLRLMRAAEPYVVADSTADPRIDAEDRRSYELTAIRAVICVPIQKSGRFVAAMAVHMETPRHWSAAEVRLVQLVASRCWESIERARIQGERERLLAAAEAANQAKDEFLAMLGHELRNPLAPILTALELMKLRDAAGSARERAVIERQVSHLTRLVDDLLDVSRIARGKVVLKRELIELSTTVRQALEVVSPLLEQRAHQVVFDDTPAAGFWVLADAARMTQVVSNLLSNAGKYTPPGGRITIGIESAAGEHVLRVRDTGIGVSAELLPRVFELFVQGGQSIDRAQGGLGLGLAIVKSLVEQHEGSVSATSEGAGRGSEFVVRLPRAQAPLGEAVHSAGDRPMARPPQNGIRLLVVDDNQDAAEMLAMALRMQGHEVHVAHDGLEALSLAAANGFDCALLDIGLPVMDGYELAARLKELPAWQRTRLVAITGYGQENDRRRARQAGFHHHLVKPVELSALSAILSDVAQK